MENTTAIVEVQMRIRKPVSIVFNAMIDPAETVNFWFTKSSGKLEVAKTVTWEWEMYGISVTAYVKEIIQNERIVIAWGEPQTIVAFHFKALADGSTYVVVKHFGFDLTGDELIPAIKDSTGGFTTVLDGMKAYLEHGINLNLIADKFPKEVSQHGK